MTKVQRTHEPAGFFVLRAPLLPVHVAERLAINDDVNDVSRSDGRADELAELLQRPAVGEALYVAGPEFLSGQHLGTSNGRKHEKVNRALRRYLLRMAYRATPFGLFAGCSVGTFGDVNALLVAGPDAQRRHVRLDSQVLFDLSALLLSDPDLIMALPAQRNTTLYSAGGSWRYLERHSDGKSDFSFRLVEVDRSPLLDRILALAKHGLPAEEYAKELMRRGVEQGAARAFTLSLVRAQLLVSSLAQSVVGGDPLERLSKTLNRFAPQSVWAGRVGRLLTALSGLNAPSMPGGAGDYERVVTVLSDIGVPTERGHTFQVELVRVGTEPRLTRDLADSVLDASRAMAILSVQSARAQHLRHLKEIFVRRFGDRDVPLLHFLDPDLGVGPSLKGVGRAKSEQAAHAINQLRGEPISLDPAQLLLLRQYGEAAATGRHEINLTAEDLGAIASFAAAKLPPCFGALVSLYRTAGDDAGQNVRGAVVQLRMLVGGSGSALVGRFLHGHPEMLRQVQVLQAKEAALSPECILAEVDFASGPRSPNVTRRPHLRGFGIPVLGPYDDAAAVVVQLRDLWLRVDGGRFVLWSNTLRREVRPRLTCMHGNNPEFDLPLYVFLRAVECEDGLDIGSPEQVWGKLWKQAWLPRLRSGNAILARESWLVNAGEVQPAKAGAHDRLARVLEAKGIPTRVLLTDRDFEIPVSAATTWARELILTRLRGRGVARFQEDLALQYPPLARGWDGEYANEVAIPFVSAGPRPERPHGMAFRRFHYLSDRYGPLSRWVYAKIYSPAGAADRLLVDVVRPMARELCADKRVNNWFYIRYADNAEHLRLRFSCADQGDWFAIAGEVARMLDQCGSGVHTRLEFGTYERETRRYGGPAAMPLVERLFRLDSELTIEALAELREAECDDTRFVFGLVTMHEMMAAMSPSAGWAEGVIHSAVDVYSRRLAKAKVAICGDLNRELGRRIDRIMDGCEAGDDAVRVLTKCARSRLGIAALLKDVVEQLTRAATVELGQWARDVLHMHCNRLFSRAIVEQEYLAYEMLSRISRRRAARNL